MTAEIHNLDRGAFVRELLAARPHRYDLRAWSDGYQIFDRGELIATFHGPQFALAGRLLRLLREDAK